MKVFDISRLIASDSTVYPGAEPVMRGAICDIGPDGSPVRAILTHADGNDKVSA